MNGQRVASLTLPVGKEGLQKAQAKAVRDGAVVRVTSQSANPELRDLCVELYGFGAPAGGAAGSSGGTPP